MKILNFKLLFLVFLLTLCDTYSQKYFNNWYFGTYAGITFNTKDGEPVVLNDGKINTNEGVSVISDIDGNLLFYTDGTTVWNKKHEIMKNGNDLAGCFSSTNSAMIVPKPGSKNLYYIFTTDCYENIAITKGLNYSIVDISLDKGLGEVIQKNTKLIGYATERLAAIKHPNGKGIWVMTQDMNLNCFSAFLLTDKGIDINPIQSKVEIFKAGVIGCMQFSPDGKKIAFAGYFEGTLNLYDFNVNTGIVSNGINLLLSPNDGTYGIEFSSNSKYLYVSYLGYVDAGYRISQYSALASNADDLIKSAKIIQSADTYGFSAIQMAPNNKIYVANFMNNYLSVINHPDSTGDKCGFESYGLNLAGGQSIFGLPLKVVNLDSIYMINAEIIKIGGDILCKNGTLELSADKDYSKYLWSTGDTSKSIIIKSAGSYYLKVEDTNGNKDSVGIFINMIGDDIKFSQSQYEYGIIETHTSSEHSFTITNNEKQDLKIEDIKIKNHPEYFKIEAPATPYIFKSNTSISVKVIFESDINIKIIDSLEIVFSEPCQLISDIVLQARSLGEIPVKFWMPDTVAKIGDKNFQMPLYSIISEKCDTSFKTNLNLKIKFKKNLYLSDRISNGKLLKEVQNEFLSFYIELQNIEITDDTSNVTNLIGDVLFSYPGSTPFEIENVQITNPFLKYETPNGSLTINDICVKNIRGIQLRNDNFLSLKNTIPTGTEIVAHCNDNGYYSIEIFNISGELIYTNSWISGIKSEKAFRISELIDNAGFYFAVFKSPGNVEALPISYIK